MWLLSLNSSSGKYGEYHLLHRWNGRQGHYKLSAQCLGHIRHSIISIILIAILCLVLLKCLSIKHIGLFLEKNTSLVACILEDEKVYWVRGSRYQGHIPDSNSMFLLKRSFKHYFLLHNCLRVRTKYTSMVHMLAIKNGAIPSGWLPRGPSSSSLPTFSRQAPPQGRQMASVCGKIKLWLWFTAHLGNLCPFSRASKFNFSYSIFLHSELTGRLWITVKTITARSFCWQK